MSRCEEAQGKGPLLVEVQGKLELESVKLDRNTLCRSTYSAKRVCSEFWWRSHFWPFLQQVHCFTLATQGSISSSNAYAQPCPATFQMVLFGMVPSVIYSWWCGIHVQDLAMSKSKHCCCTCAIPVPGLVAFSCPHTRTADFPGTTAPAKQPHVTIDMFPALWPAVSTVCN